MVRPAPRRPKSHFLTWYQSLGLLFPPPPRSFAAAAMVTSSALTLSSSPSITNSSVSTVAPFVAPPYATAATLVVAPFAVHLNGSNFMLWKALCLPTFTGARLHALVVNSL